MTETQAFFQLLAMLLLDPRSAVLLALLAAAAVIDARTMRIPNWLTGAGAVAGVALGVVFAVHPLEGLWTSVAGLLTGFALLLPLWLIRVLGAGDVKLMAAVGAFLGAAATLQAVVYVVVAGGVAALIVAAAHGALGRLFTNVYFMVTVPRMPAGGPGGRPISHPASVGKLPYGICICIGTAVFLVARLFGLS